MKELIMAIVLISFIFLFGVFFGAYYNNKPRYDLNNDKKIDMQDISILLSKLDK